MKPFVSTLLAITVLTGCGGGTGPVPDVTGERLDVAKSALDDAGFSTEEIGGGAFGIVDESNWTVCQTDPKPGRTGSDTVKLIVDRTCQSASNDSTTGESDSEQTPEPTKEPTPKPTEDAAAQPTSTRIRVPNVVGMDHQAAQNRLQAAGLFQLLEEDASGQDRVLLYDRNWTVVRQSPSAGTRVSENRAITLFSLKDGE